MRFARYTDAFNVIYIADNEKDDSYSLADNDNVISVKLTSLLIENLEESLFINLSLILRFNSFIACQVF